MVRLPDPEFAKPLRRNSCKVATNLFVDSGPKALKTWQEFANAFSVTQIRNPKSEIRRSYIGMRNVGPV